MSRRWREELEGTAAIDWTDRGVYMVGIGGCGMSGLGRMLAARGARVSGSDMAPSEITAGLVRDGIGVLINQGAGQVPEHAELVIASAAIKADHPEMLTAVERGVPTLTYAEALGRCMASSTGVSIAGTHGKSTTSAMLGHTLTRCGLDPTVLVGATCPQLARPGEPPSGFRLGSARTPEGPFAGAAGLLIAEACEYNRSFHALAPTVAAITSVEADHLDVYGSLDEVVRAFAGFAGLLPSAADGGRLLIAHEGAHRREVAASTSAKVETIGFSPAADWHVTYDSESGRVGLNRGDQHVANWILMAPGEHMAIDSAIAATLAIWLGAPAADAAEALAGFEGLDRRMQRLGSFALGDAEAPPVRVYDDYGHHPTEIDATLRALRERERPERAGGRLICVFQPHQHSRTRFLLDEFAQAFGHADVVIVPHIYFIRDSEVERSRVSASDLVDRLRSRGVQAMHLYPFEAIVEHLQTICRPGDTLVVMGAGPVWTIARDLVEAWTGAGRPPRSASGDEPHDDRIHSRTQRRAPHVVRRGRTSRPAGATRHRRGVAGPAADPRG